MTTPTQAQIEAALTGIQRLRLEFERNHWRIIHRVDGKDMSASNYDLVTAALTAAAEVGGQNVGSEAGVCATHVLRDKELIERCAQVAENCELNDIDRDSPGTAIAAAIRALKE